MPEPYDALSSVTARIEPAAIHNKSLLSPMVSEPAKAYRGPQHIPIGATGDRYD
jgi:hypothetical protein